jgi:hypothetical protein
MDLTFDLSPSALTLPMLALLLGPGTQLAGILTVILARLSACATVTRPPW